MTSAQAALVAATRRLRAAGIEDPARDARVLLAHAMGLAPGRLTLVLPEPLAPAAEADFQAAITRRETRQPVSQIIGTRAFYGRDFRVTPDVLDPRPETETLIELALQKPFVRVLDLGTGSGCILLSLLAERAESTGVGCDISAEALKVAAQNAHALGLAGRADFRLSNWYEDLPGAGRFDLIVSNPPYIAATEMAALAPEVGQWEPAMALTPGGDGLDAYRRICAGAAEFLQPGGWMIVEIGAKQGADVLALMQTAGFTRCAVAKDMDDRDRVVLGQRP